MMSNEDIINNLHYRGYDGFINGDDIIVLKDGFTSTSSLAGSLDLMTPKSIMVFDKEMTPPPMSISEVVDLIIYNHNNKKDIYDGKYDNLGGMSKKEFKESLRNFFKPKQR